MTTITLDVPATTISLEVPDELAGEYKITPEIVPALIKEALSAKIAKTSVVNGDAPARPVYSEVIDFLSSNPTTEQIVAFKISEAAQDRLEELLYKNREEELTAEEQAELDTYGHLNHLMIRLKARALGGKNLFEQTP
jgi:hypothetical protein